MTERIIYNPPILIRQHTQEHWDLSQICNILKIETNWLKDANPITPIEYQLVNLEFIEKGGDFYKISLNRFIFGFGLIWLIVCPGFILLDGWGFLLKILKNGGKDYDKGTDE